MLSQNGAGTAIISAYWSDNKPGMHLQIFPMSFWNQIGQGIEIGIFQRCGFLRKATIVITFPSEKNIDKNGVKAARSNAIKRLFDQLWRLYRVG